MNRFQLKKSCENPNWWVLTDTVNNVVIRFEEHKFNETQKVTVIDDIGVTETTADDMAKIMREIGDYMFHHHIGIALNVIYDIEYSEDETDIYLCRYKSPKWKLCIGEDDIDAKVLATSLRKAAEWLYKSWQHDK